jgi:hypothetical protein
MGEDNESKKPVGRPLLYDPKLCQEMIDFCAQGYSIEAFAGKIGVNKVTVYDWINKYPEFSNAKNTAQEKCRLFWETLGTHGAAGKLPGFNASAYIFNMKNRFGWRDNIHHSGSIEIDTTKDKMKEVLASPDLQDAIALIAEAQIEETNEE